jgi:hypothetical protein
LLVLFNQSVLGLSQDLLERGFIEIIERHHDPEAADEFRDQPVFQQVFGLDVAEDSAGATILRQGRNARSYFAERSGHSEPPLGTSLAAICS